MPVYNILWADDQIDSLCDESTLSLFKKKYEVNVVEKFRNADDLCGYLDKHECRGIDAVVVDANFPSGEWEANKERDISGLISVSQVINLYKEKCPFILFTGRRDLVSEGAFKYFFDNEYVVMKGESLEKLVDKIKEAVSSQASTEWAVRTRYAEVLDKCGEFDRMCVADTRKLITKLLVGILENKIEDKETYFNELRSSVFEKMQARFTKQMICPPDLSLNAFKDYLRGELDNYPKKRLCPDALIDELQYVIKGIQDGSHSGKKLKLHVRDYIQNNKDCMMVHSMVFVTIDIVVWAVEYLKSHPDAENNVANWRK